MSTDRIIMRELRFYGYHGVLEAERKLGQEFVVNLEIFLPLQKAGLTDRLENSLDYARVYDTVRAIVTGEPVLLLETLAEKIAAAVLAHDPVEGVEVRVRKQNPPLPGITGGVEICIYRKK